MPGFFEAIGNAFTGAGGGGGALLLGLAALAGGEIISSRANEEATRLASEAELANARAIEQGNLQAQRRIDEVRQATAPAQSRLRAIIARDPNMLTPDQRVQLQDLRENVNRNLAASGLRGSGRTQVAVLRKVEDQVRGGLVRENRDRADVAAQQLANQFANATSQTAALDRATGQSAGSALRNVGENAANLATTAAANRGKALGDVASLVRSELKAGRRESRFNDLLAARTRENRKETL